MTTNPEAAPITAEWETSDGPIGLHESFQVHPYAEWDRWHYRWSPEPDLVYVVFYAGLVHFCALIRNGHEEWSRQCRSRADAQSFAESDYRREKQRENTP